MSPPLKWHDVWVTDRVFMLQQLTQYCRRLIVNTVQWTRHKLTESFRVGRHLSSSLLPVGSVWRTDTRVVVDWVDSVTPRSSRHRCTTNGREAASTALQLLPLLSRASICVAAVSGLQGHWRRQMWGIGARAPSTSSNLIFTARAMLALKALY